MIGPICFLILIFLAWRTVCQFLGWRGFDAKKRWLRSLGAIAIWVFGIPAFVFIDVVVFHPNSWPPFALEHHLQQQQVFERIQSAGGWDAIRKDCLQLATDNKEKGIRWSFGHGYPVEYNLPTALSAVKPKEVDFLPRRFETHQEEAPDIEIVKIKFFGGHSTGWHSQPYYGLEVVWGPGTNDYHPESVHAVSGYRHSSYRKVAENIYEVY